MRKRSELLFSLILVPIDYLSLVAAFVVAYILRVKLDVKPVAHPIAALTFLQIALIVLPVWILIFGLAGLYNQSNMRGRLDEVGKIFIAVSGGVMFLILLDFLQPVSLFPSKSVPVYGYVFALLFVLVARSIVRAIQRGLFSRGVGIHRVVVIGSGEIAQRLASSLIPEMGYRMVAAVDRARGAAKRLPGLTVYSDFIEAETALGRRGFDEIIQADSALSQEEILELVTYANNNHVSYRFIPNQFGLYTAGSILETVAGMPMVSLRLTPLDGWGRIVKRAFDVVGATTALILFSPIFLVVSVVLMIRDPGPVFYRHRRLSRAGGEVQVIKFRTMRWQYCTGPDRPYKTAEDVFTALNRPDLVAEFKRDQKVSDDPRVSRLGQLLRRSSLDELPQLINVLHGEMSLVGPRPVVESELERYGAYGASFLALKPGITGLWQISGRNDISYAERVKLDIYYVEHWSLWIDMKILIKTGITLISHRGAY